MVLAMMYEAKKEGLLRQEGKVVVEGEAVTMLKRPERRYCSNVPLAHENASCRSYSCVSLLG